MNCYLLLFKSGASVTVYTEEEPEYNTETMAHPPIDITLNQANQLKWFKENEGMLESLKHKMATIEHEADLRGRQTAMTNIERTKVRVV